MPLGRQPARKRYGRIPKRVFYNLCSAVFVLLQTGVIKSQSTFKDVLPKPRHSGAKQQAGAAPASPQWAEDPVPACTLTASSSLRAWAVIVAMPALRWEDGLSSVRTGESQLHNKNRGAEGLGGRGRGLGKCGVRAASGSAVTALCISSCPQSVLIWLSVPQAVIHVLNAKCFARFMWQDFFCA